MPLTEKDFQVLDAIDRHEITTQRQLAAHAGISLGQVNYVLKSFLDRGLVKLGNFKRNPSKMVSYAYLLTPKGIEEKSRLAVRFLVRRLKEYNDLRQILRNRIAELEGQGISRVIIVGPAVIREFLRSMIDDEYEAITVARQCDTWEDLPKHTDEDFDVVFIFDDSEKSMKEIAAETGIPKRKLISLW